LPLHLPRISWQDIRRRGSKLDFTMPPSNENSTAECRIKLAHALGFMDYPTNTTAAPYLSYILRQCTGGETIEDFVELFIEVLEHFRMDKAANGTSTVCTIQALIDKFASSGFQNVFADTVAGGSRRKEQAEDTVMCVVGTWATMLSSFQHKSRSRRVVATYSIFADATISQGSVSSTSPTTQPTPISATIAPYDEDVAGLITGSGLLPGGEWDDRINSQSDMTTKLVSLILNASTRPNQSLQDIIVSNYKRTSNSRMSYNHRVQIEKTYVIIDLSSHALLEDLNAHESQSIKATRLNAFTLNVLSAVTIEWTPNVSRHMLLTKANGHFVLELFSLPCAFTAIGSPEVGVPIELTQEIEESYAVLFNAWPSIPLHARLGALFGLRKVCRCWSCSSYRFRQRCINTCKMHDVASSRIGKNVAPNLHHNDFDPALETLMTSQSMRNWTLDDFPLLWSRITRLEQHLQTSRPWSLSVLFRDRRDSMQFWTFLYVSQCPQYMQTNRF
jgi:hypothetical protein